MNITIIGFCLFLVAGCSKAMGDNGNIQGATNPEVIKAMETIEGRARSFAASLDSGSVLVNRGFGMTFHLYDSKHVYDDYFKRADSLAHVVVTTLTTTTGGPDLVLMFSYPELDFEIEEPAGYANFYRYSIAELR